MLRLRTVLFATLASVSLATAVFSQADPAPRETAHPSTLLETALLAEDPAALARAARSDGDVLRGALLFHGSRLHCARCHLADASRPRLGPSLAARPEGLRDADLVDAVLRPSLRIREGFESVALVTREGEVVSGLLASESTDAIVVRDAARDFQERRVEAKSLVSRSTPSESIMPAGLVNLLSTRNEALDLFRYLFEIADEGEARALELQAIAALVTPPGVPAYESDIDHAGLISELDGESLKRGREIYQRVCVNCHGTREAEGSLPTSLRFAEGRFKNGSDPYSMYRTLTHGFGVMAPQSWMVPREKYDVIHYIREAYLRRHNPSQWTEIDAEYLARLPEGDERGPAPSDLEPWSQMDYGPFLINTYEIGDDASNFAFKGIAVRLDPGPGGVTRGSHFLVFDHDTLRVAAVWKGRGFIDFHGIHFDGRHNAHPRIVGELELANRSAPGWADPDSGEFTDPRLRGRDGRPYGPLPASWAKYRGLHSFGDRVVIEYSVGDTRVRESPGLLVEEGIDLVLRTIEVGPHEGELVVQIAEEPGAELLRVDESSAVLLVESTDAEVEDASRGKDRGTAGAGEVIAGLLDAPEGASWRVDDGALRLALAANSAQSTFAVWTARVESRERARSLARTLDTRGVPVVDLEVFTRGGPARWREPVKLPIVRGGSGGPFAVDTIIHPERNPWAARFRATGIDFLPSEPRADAEGSASDAGAPGLVVSTWDGDVWTAIPVGGKTLDDEDLVLEWRRFASGLFQPLGLKLIDGAIHVVCRDQIVILRDQNGDGEADHYRCFNSDHQVTDHFHEFAMDLQTDAEGNLYYTKGARHALQPLVPHHGTLLRVAKDGSKTDILATGFRAPNGVCVNGDGTFFITDQEGHWIPKNRLNWVRPGRFYGNMWGYTRVTDPSDDAMEPPLAWITNEFDRSPGEMLWVPEQTWGALGGSLLELSYGMGKVFLVPHERVRSDSRDDDVMQGGAVELPLEKFPTGIMRGRFRPGGQDLYLAGMFAWAGNQSQPGGVYRVRRTAEPLVLPLSWTPRVGRLELRFSEPLDVAAAADRERYELRVWGLERSARYGSKHIDERPLEVSTARVLEDGRTLQLEIPELAPTRSVAVAYRVRTRGGDEVRGSIHGTIHVTW